MLERLGYPSKAFVTARELKQQIDRSIDRVTLLLSAIPAVGLIVAALGVANLMAAGVAARSRQTAVLRAIGVTKNQMSRMVIGEALVLGLLGSVMGLALGFYLGRTSNFMTELLSGFQPEFAIPWAKVCLGAALATGLCLLAALIPARYASRSNIVAALSD
jgi:putative ABC transport system permease protein